LLLEGTFCAYCFGLRLDFISELDLVIGLLTSEAWWSRWFIAKLWCNVWLP